MRLPWGGGQTGHHHAKPKPHSNFAFNGIMVNIYQTIRGRTKSPRTLESNSKDPLSAAYIDIYIYVIYIYIENIFNIFYQSTQPKKNIFELRSNGDRLF